MIVVVAVVGLAVIFGAILWFQSAKKKVTAQWPSTSGRVLSAQLYRPSSSGDISENEPIVSYEYAVDGRTYQCRRIKYGLTPKAAPALAKYKVGSQVAVFYNPANPADAILER